LDSGHQAEHFNTLHLKVVLKKDKMCKVSIKLLILCFFTLFIGNVAKNKENKNDYSDYVKESFDYSGTAETSIKSSSTEDYDYNQLIEDNQYEEKPSFFTKIETSSQRRKKFDS